MANFSHRLRTTIAVAADPLKSLMNGIMCHARVASSFSRYLQLQHGMIRASVSLMNSASLEAAKRRNEPLYRILEEYLNIHAVEELNHDEWLLDDLASLGQSEAVVAERPSRLVAAMVGAQYYWIRHFDPIMIIGYIAVLEGSPPTEKGLNDLLDRTSLPRRCLRTAFKHAMLDIKHASDLDDFIDRLPLQDHHREDICFSALTTIDQLSD
jgi:hypothetical protein